MTVENLTRYFNYLARLRRSGKINMWGAVPYLARDCMLEHDEADKVFQQWQDNFEGDDGPNPKELATKVLGLSDGQRTIDVMAHVADAKRRFPKILARLAEGD